MSALDQEVMVPGDSPVQLTDIRAADKVIWTLLAEKTRTGIRKSLEVRPLEKAWIEVKDDPRVTRLLICRPKAHLVGTAKAPKQESGSPKTPGQKSTRTAKRQKNRLNKLRKREAAAQQEAAKLRKRLGRGKGEGRRRNAKRTSQQETSSPTPKGKGKGGKKRRRTGTGARPRFSGQKGQGKEGSKSPTPQQTGSHKNGKQNSGS